MEILLTLKYDELKRLEYETSSNILSTSRSITPNYFNSQQQNFRRNIIKQSPYNTIDLATNNMSVAFTSIKEADEDSGIDSLTSSRRSLKTNTNHHSTTLRVDN